MFCVKNEKIKRPPTKLQTKPNLLRKTKRKKGSACSINTQLSLQPWSSRRTAPAPWDALVWDITSMEVFKVGGAWSTLG